MFRQPMPYRSDLPNQVGIERDFVVVDNDDIVEETFEQSRADRIISLNPKSRFTFEHGTNIMQRAIATGDVDGDNETELAIGSMNGTLFVYKMDFTSPTEEPTPLFSARQLGTIVDICIGSIYVLDRKFNIPVRRRVVLVASAEGLLHVFDQRWLSSRADQSAKQFPASIDRKGAGEMKEMPVSPEGADPGLEAKAQDVPGQENPTGTDDLRARQNSTDSTDGSVAKHSQVAGKDADAKDEEDSSSGVTTARAASASAAKVIKPVIQISIPYNATAMVLDTSRTISRIFVGTDEGDVIAYDFTGNVEENFTYLATLVKRASWKVDSGVTSFCLTHRGRSQSANFKEDAGEAAGDGQAYPVGVGLSSGGYAILDTTHIMEKLMFNGVEETEQGDGMGEVYYGGIMVDDPEVLFDEMRRNIEDQKPKTMGASSSGTLKAGDASLTGRESRTGESDQTIRKFKWKKMPAVTGGSLISEVEDTKDIGSGGNRSSLLMVGSNGGGEEDVANALSPFLEDMGNGDNFSSVPLASVMEMDMQMGVAPTSKNLRRNSNSMMRLQSLTGADMVGGRIGSDDRHDDGDRGGRNTAGLTSRNNYNHVTGILHSNTAGPSMDGVEDSDGSGANDDYADGTTKHNAMMARVILANEASIFYDNTLVAINCQGGDVAIRHIENGECVWHESLGRSTNIFCVSGVRGTANGNGGGNCAIVAICGWDGSTFLFDKEQNLVRFKFEGGDVAAFQACTVSRKDKITGEMVQELCLVYVTLDSQIFLYTVASGYFEKGVGVDSLLDLIGVEGREKVLEFLDTLAESEETGDRKSRPKTTRNPQVTISSLMKKASREELFAAVTSALVKVVAKNQVYEDIGLLRYDEDAT